MLKKVDTKSFDKKWNKPTIKKLEVNRTLGGISQFNENNGHPDGSGKTGGQTSS